MVTALHPSCGLASGLNGGKQQTDHDSDDRDHDQKLDQRKSTLASGDTFHHLFLDDDGGGVPPAQQRSRISTLSANSQALVSPDTQQRSMTYRSSRANIRDRAQFPEGATTDSTDDQAGLLTSGSAFDHAFPQFKEPQWQM
jgi:hypothetical protein